MPIYIFLLAVITALTGCKPEDFQDTGVLSIEDFYIIGSNDTPKVLPNYKLAGLTVVAIFGLK